MTQEQKILIELTENFLNGERVQKCKAEYQYSVNRDERLLYEAIRGLEKWLKLFEGASEKANEESECGIEEAKERIEVAIKFLHGSNDIITIIRDALVDFGYQNIADRLGNTALGFSINQLSRALEDLSAKEVSNNA